MPDTQPTVVLVHGAFADASSFAAVVPELLTDGLPVVVPLSGTDSPLPAQLALAGPGPRPCRKTTVPRLAGTATPSQADCPPHPRGHTPAASVVSAKRKLLAK